MNNSPNARPAFSLETAINPGVSPDDEKNALDTIGEPVAVIESSIPNQFIDDLDRLLNEVIEENQTAKVSLYKYDNNTAGTEKSFIFEWENEIPSAHKIGLQFGSGRYMIIITVPKSKKYPDGRIPRRLKIHEYYDKLKKINDERNVFQVAPMSLQPINEPVQVNTSEQFSGAMGMIKEVMSMIVPLLQLQKQEQPAPAPIVDLTPILMQSYQMTQEVLKKNLLDTQKIYKDIVSQNVNDDDDEGESAAMEQIQKPSMLEKLQPLIDQFLPLILGSGPKAAAVTEIVKAAPLFKQILSDKNQLSEMIKEFDQKIGKPETDKLLKKLKVVRS